MSKGKRTLFVVAIIVNMIINCTIATEITEDQHKQKGGKVDTRMYMYKCIKPMLKFVKENETLLKNLKGQKLNKEIVDEVAVMVLGHSIFKNTSEYCSDEENISENFKKVIPGVSSV